MNTSLSLKLLLSLTLLLSASAPALAARDGQSGKAERRAERRADLSQRQVNNQQQKDAQRQQRDQQRDLQRAMNQQKDQQRANEIRQRDQQRAIEQAQRDQQRAQNKARRAATNVPIPQSRNDNNRWDRRTSDNRWNDRDNHWSDRNDKDHGHWDQRWYDRNRQQAALDRRFRNWNDQRDYLKANLRKINQIAKLNALQQQQLNAQMQSAYLAYHNNNWSGPYNWDYYSEPQFLDYLQVNQPSLLDRILGYLGMGPLNGGYGYGNGYLYSSDWGVERDQLAQNMYRIHQLALAGRITPLQEQQLLAQMRGSFSAYHNNNWNGGYGWSQYSDPGFVDYLNNSQPGILTTIRSYLGM